MNAATTMLPARSPIASLMLALRVFAGSALLAAVAGLSACGGDKAPPPPAADPAAAPASKATPLKLEKTDPKLGFIKLTNCAPVLIATEKRCFEDEGLFVNVEPQANSKVLLDRVIWGELDGGHMLPTRPSTPRLGLARRPTSSRPSRWA